MVLLSGLSCSAHARDGVIEGMLGLEPVGADRHSIWTSENFPSAPRRTAGPQASLRLGSAHTTGQTQATQGLAKTRPQTQAPAWVTAGAPQETRYLSLHRQTMLLPSGSMAYQHWDLGGPQPFLMKSIEKNFLHEPA